MGDAVFSYVLPVHNDEGHLGPIVARLVERLRAYPGSEVLLVENGSRDASAAECRALEGVRDGVSVRAFSLAEAGMGYALHRGMLEAFSTGAPAGPAASDAWVVLTASDLPFGFSDLDALLALPPGERARVDVVIGSKAHARSNVGASPRRKLASAAFRALRFAVVGMRTGDSQGTFLLRAPLAKEMAGVVQARDFFFSTELCARLEKRGVRPLELPIDYPGETRPSTVRLGRDGMRMLRQLVDLRRRL